MQSLIQKYNVPGPRYTSYPAVPHWNPVPPSPKEWKKHVKAAFDHNREEGISVYLHLPYCESLCTYCGCNTRITVNHKVEKPYIKSLLKEWKLYLEIFEEYPQLSEIHLGGGTPTFFHPDNLSELIEGLLEGSNIPQHHEYGFEAHPNSTTGAHLETLYDLGFRRLSLGIQDFDPIVQRTVNRVQPFELVQRVTTEARKVGYTSINYDLIYGLPKQTISSIRETIEKVSRLMPDRIAFYGYAHVPWKKPGQRMFTDLDLPQGEEKSAMYELGKELLGSLGYYEIGMDHFALPTDDLYKSAKKGTLHRNFMGYTPTQTNLVVGLGASSIGDTGTAYAQNVKQVERYREILEEGELPIFKGHSLTENEIATKQHILDLMCRMETSWLNSGDLLYPLNEAEVRLKELISDDLVSLEKNKIKVTEKGRPFVRNVCMELDPNVDYRGNQQVFSKVV